MMARSIGGIMNTLIQPVPEPLSAEVMQLVDDYRRAEINRDEYNRRFAELQEQMDKIKMEQK